jgi:Leucine-rich repeat (LRR) protein
MNANRNNIESVPREMGNLINLNLLVIRKNDFKTVPVEVCDLSTNYGTRIFMDQNVDCQ